MTTLAEKIAVMQAAERGEKIQVRVVIGREDIDREPWADVDDTEFIGWNWNRSDYRVAPKPPIVHEGWVVFYRGHDKNIYSYGWFKTKELAEESAVIFVPTGSATLLEIKHITVNEQQQ
jgi:hypothetical protein